MDKDNGQSKKKFLQASFGQVGKSSGNFLDLPNQQKIYKESLSKKSRIERKNNRHKKFLRLIDQCGTSRDINNCEEQLTSSINLIGFILSQKNQVMMGTCLVINSHYAILTAHQFLNLETKEKYFIKLPRLENNGESFLQFQLDMVKSFSLRYSQTLAIQDDYAFLKIKGHNYQEEIERRIKHLRFLDGSNYITRKFTLNGCVYGFAKGIPQPNLFQLMPRVLLKSKGQFKFNQNKFVHNAYTLNGMSGSPIFVEIEDNDQLYIIGIHVSGNCNKQQNYALMFTEAFYKDIKKYLGCQIQIKKLQEVVKMEQTLKERLQNIKKMSQQEQKLKALGIITIHLIKQLNKYEQLSIYFQFNKMHFENIIVQINEVLFKNNPNFILNLLGSIRKLKKYGNFKYLCAFLRSLQSDIPINFSQNIDITKPHHLFPFIKDSAFRNQKSIISLKYFSSYILQFYNVIQTIKTIKSKNDQDTGILLKGSLTSSQIIDQNQYLFKQFLNMDDYHIQQFETRVIKFCLMYKHYGQILSKKSFLRIYINLIKIIFQEVRDKLNLIIEFVQKQKYQFKQELEKLQKIEVQFMSFDLRRTIKRYKFDAILQIFQPIWEIKQDYKKIYQKQFTKWNLNKNIIKYLVQYQINFIDILYNGHIIPIIKSIQKKINENYLFEKYFGRVRTQNSKMQNIVQQKTNIFSVISVQYDNIPQNNRYKQIKNHFKQFQFNKIFCSNQTKEHTYKLSQLTYNEHKKYNQLKKNLVAIYMIGKSEAKQFKGVGSLLSSKKIITALHVFGKQPNQIRNSNELKKKLKYYRIVYNNIQYEIDYFDPIQIIAPPRNIEDDIIILTIKLQIPSINRNIPLINKSRTFINTNQDKRNQRYFAILIAHGNENKLLSYKKAIGLVPLYSLDYPNYYTPLIGYQTVSGAPIFIYINNIPYLLGVYTGKIQQDHLNRKYGKYADFNPKKFKDKYEQVQQINPQQLPMKNSDTFGEFIIEHYGTIDLFLLRVVMQILKLNYYHYYLERLQIINIIPDIDNNLNILFNNLELIDKQAIKADRQTNQRIQTHYRQRIKHLNQGYQGQFNVFDQVQLINLQAFDNFMSEVKKIFPQEASSQILSLKHKEKSVNKFAQKIDNYFQIIFEKNTKRYILVKRKNIKETKKLNKQLKYFTIFDLYFVLKPQQRLQRLNILSSVTRTDYRNDYLKKKIQLKQKRIRQRSQELNRQMNNSLTSLTLSIQTAVQNQQDQIMVILTNIFNQGFKAILIQITNDRYQFSDEHKDKSDFQDKILQNIRVKKSFDNSSLINFYKNYQNQQFKKYYRLIKKWTLIQDISQYLFCLDGSNYNE